MLLRVLERQIVSVASIYFRNVQRTQRYLYYIHRYLGRDSAICDRGLIIIVHLIIIVLVKTPDIVRVPIGIPIMR